MDYSEDSKNFYLNEKNKKKKADLIDKFGMDFHDKDSKASPAVMNEFLNYVERWEEEWEKAGNKKVIEILGNPVFKSVNDITEYDLQNEIASVLSIHSKHNMLVHIIEKDKVSDSEFYHFLTVILPEHETYDMDVPGMRTNFIYEEFFDED